MNRGFILFTTILVAGILGGFEGYLLPLSVAIPLSMLTGLAVGMTGAHIANDRT